MRKTVPEAMLEACAKDPDFVYSSQLIVVAAEPHANGSVTIHVRHNRKPNDADVLRMALETIADVHGRWMPSRRSVFGWGVLGGLALGRCLQMLGLV